ncbi:hypothetical protein JTB14_017083 [Gonioctena quinquepunctata]|nr:hypothetical protein JTB14_017083 [Gonioctena quinquepunctata]
MATNSDKVYTTLVAVNAMGQSTPPSTLYKYERIPVSLAAAYYELEKEEKMEQQKLKDQRDRELKKEERNKKTATKSIRKKQVKKTISEEEERVESGSSIDDIDDENQEQD